MEIDTAERYARQRNISLEDAREVIAKVRKRQRDRQLNVTTRLSTRRQAWQNAFADNDDPAKRKKLQEEREKSGLWPAHVKRRNAQMEKSNIDGEKAFKVATWTKADGKKVSRILECLDEACTLADHIVQRQLRNLPAGFPTDIDLTALVHALHFWIDKLDRRAEAVEVDDMFRSLFRTIDLPLKPEARAALEVYRRVKAEEKKKAKGRDEAKRKAWNEKFGKGKAKVKK